MRFILNYFLACALTVSAQMYLPLVNNPQANSGSVGSVPWSTNALLIFINTGQSRGDGSGSTNSLTTNTIPYAFTQGSGYPIADLTPPVSGLYAASERNSGTETPTSAFIQELHYLGLPNPTASIDQSYSGEPYIGYLNPGTTIWTNQTMWLSNVVHSATGTNCWSPGFAVYHGEADASNPGYQTNLENWVYSGFTNAVLWTAQTNSSFFRLFHSQTSAIRGSSDTNSIMALAAETIKTPHSNVLVCAGYQFPSNLTNSPHYQSIGYQHMAELYATAFMYEYFSNGWYNVFTNWTRTNQYIWLTHGEPIGGLVLDPGKIPSPTNHGIHFWTNGVEEYPSSVTVVGSTSNQVLVTLPTASAGTMRIGFWDTGITSWNGNGGDLGNGVINTPDFQCRTDIRNNNQIHGALSGLTNYFYTCYQEIPIP